MEVLPAHHYQFSGLLTSFASLFLVVLVYRKAVDRYLKSRFVLYYLSLFVWSLSLFICTSVYDYQLAYFFTQMTHAGAIMIPVFFLHFTFAYLNSMSRIQRCFLQGLYGMAVFFMVINLFFRELFFGNVVPKLSFPYFPNAGLFYTPWVITFATAVLISHIVLFRAMIASSGLRKKQIRFFLLANALGYFGGVGCFLPVYDLPFFPFPYGPYGVLLLSFVSGYAILRYRFIDLQFFLRKTIVFAALLTFIIGTFSFMLFVFQNVLSSYINANPFLIAAISAAIIILTYDGLRNFLITLTDKILFQRKSEIKDILNRLSQQVMTILDLDHIGKTILSTLGETLRLESGMIVVHQKKQETYRLLDHFGMSTDQITESVRELIEKPEIIKAFQRENRILNMDQPQEESKVAPEIKSWMTQAKGRVSIPLMINEDQFGLLILGKKKSDQEFTQEEVDFFPSVASQAALAIRNGRLIETVMEEREAKLRAEDTARRVHYAETLGHEMKNKLAMSVLTAKNITDRTVPKLKSIHEKYLAGKIAEDLSTAMGTLYDQVYKSAQELKEHLDVMKIITKTAQSHLSSDAEIMEEVYVKMVWEDTVKDLNVKDVDIQFQGPGDKNFIVWGNSVRLQQVFRNLIQNSLDAMRSHQPSAVGRQPKAESEKGVQSSEFEVQSSEKKIQGTHDSPAITLECSIKEIDGKAAGYFVYTDNGPGVPEEFQANMFNKGTSTKPKPRSRDFMASGSGYGLYMCKDIIEILHKGKLWYDKDHAGGARFVFWVPMGN